VDEANTFWMAHEGLWSAVQKTSHWPGQSILYSAIASLFCVDAGRFREFILRFPTLIGMAVAGYFVYKLAEQGIGKRSGLVAILLFAFNPPIVLIGTQARSYGLALAAVAGSCWMLYRWVETQERQYLIGYVIASTLIFYLHYLFAVLFCAHAAYLAVVFLRERRMLRWRELIVAYAAIGALVLPLLPHIRLLLREGHTLVFTDAPWVVNLTDWLLPSMVAFGLVIAALLIQLLAPGCFGGCFSDKRPPILQQSVLVLLLTWWLIGPVLLFLVSKATPLRMFVVRYLVYSAVAQVLLLAYGGYALFGPRMSSAWALIAVVLSTASPVTILAGRKPGPEALRPFMRIVQAESIGTSPPVFFRSELPEADFYNWRRGNEKDSYLYTPFVAYPMKNRLLPLPYHLTDEVKAHISGVVDSQLMKEPKVLFVTHDDTWAPWIIERMRQAGFEASVHSPNSFTVIVFRRPAS
jgi:4-amino-4-deoxy-L-arabinose transferase-like glycosyltransferase